MCATVNPVDEDLGEPRGVSASARDASPRGRRDAARQGALRTHNLALVLEHVARAEPLSRAEVAERAGLTRATVSSLVELLLAARILEWSPSTTARTVGRPAAPVRLARGTLAGLGLEVGANHLAAVVVDLTGARLAQREVRGDFAAPSPADTLARLATLASLTWQQAAAQHPGLTLLGVEVAVPGIVRDGVVLDAPRLAWVDVPAEAIVRAALRDARGADASDEIPVAVGNEASLAAVAEAHARGGASFLYLSGGIGVGGAHVVDGRVQGGAHGFATELGHLTVDPAGPRCRCGATGCLEQYVGAQALARTPLPEAGWALGVALAAAVNLLDVETLVLGGTLAPLLPQLRAPLEAELATRVLAYPWARPALDAARVHDLPSLQGAALGPVLAVLADPERVVVGHGTD
ncbi:ROK family transcriptional regulator [Miniimonas arenae]|uniref:ROK family transcriptional regulator n=1 Tax=Miniimonas arenae TaxID=676201 RepID=A0A5C5BCT3_9MICO|nr:ROK family transcriptional regulator [Miniimonas arenae]